MQKQSRIWHRILTGLFLLLSWAPPTLTQADGGLIIHDYELWSQIEEGKQIAVVRLGEDDTAQIDLFISLLDTSGESHEITFFIPLGNRPAGFDVIEESSLDFEETQTEELDRHLRTAWSIIFAAFFDGSSPFQTRCSISANEMFPVSSLTSYPLTTIRSRVL